MKKLGKNNISFPETLEEAQGWTPTSTRRMLHRQVMCLARTRVEGKWCAYCFPVPGINHDNEEYLWENEGVKLPKEIALILFPYFEGIPYAK
jgi:hypothetical protein